MTWGGCAVDGLPLAQPWDHAPTCSRWRARTAAAAQVFVTVKLNYYRGSSLEELACLVPEDEVQAWVSVARHLHGSLLVTPHRA